ncbi:MAG: carbohydrate kinase [Flavobacteriia bacterium]|nr:MAG: carbohydrate kinase [Flavobacteriia bacterium]
MTDVIAIFDIGKTNKKIFLFDKNLTIVYEDIISFDEITDDDGFPCDDIEAIENWIDSKIDTIQKEGNYRVKAINFTTHGATVVYLDENGKRITPLYNYLKPLEDIDFTEFYNKYGGVNEFSRKTASPAYGMLNAGLQIYWLKNKKPQYWENVRSILHYPQYLSYLFSKKITADFTSIGAHTATWDFDKMEYHYWLEKEGISLPEPEKGDEVVFINEGDERIAIGSGLHDSSSSLIPLLQEYTGSEFILLSTGTWILSMNPFSKEKLTQSQLEQNCLCFLTPEKQQVKSSMQFLGHVHEVNEKKISEFFNEKESRFFTMELNKELCEKVIDRSEKIFFPNGIPQDFMADLQQINRFKNYKQAYAQLMYEISRLVFEGIELILDKDHNLKDIYISGGFSKNEYFRYYLGQLLPEVQVKISKISNESALGAALLMKKYLIE